MLFFFLFFFFFSSRRRHTRFDCDWSSDVCSSDLLQERLFQIEGEKQSLLTQLGQTRQTYALLEEGLQRHDAELSQERIENQTYREQIEKLSQERDQLQERLSQIQVGKQSLFVQLEQMSRTRLQMEERIKRLEERLLQDHRQKLL